jgi:hypothetical protein
VGLAWNTKRLLAAQAEGETARGSRVEYHFLSGRRLFDATIVTADRNHSSAGEWVVLPAEADFYSVSVVSRPTYSLPQELCLSFNCYFKEESIGKGSKIGPPIEEVALEFGALLSVLAREPLLPLGIHRQDDKPIRNRGVYRPPFRQPAPHDAVETGIDSRELGAIIRGLATAPEGDTRSVLFAAQRYHSALSISGFDPSTAYLLLVSAVETLAGHHYKDVQDQVFSFENVKKWERARDLLAGLRVSARNKEIIEQVKAELVKQEHVVKKFLKFVSDFIPSTFWYADPLHPTGYGLPPIAPDKLKSAF